MTAWYVIQTKPKKEGDVQCQLTRANYMTFLPKMKGCSSVKPLFPSYLFVLVDFEEPQHHRLIRFTRGVRQILGNHEGPQPISEIIVETLREKTLNGSLIEQSLFLKDGDEVRVKRGILKDLDGIIERNIPAQGRVKVLFKWMNGTMRAVLKYTDLEKAA